MTLNAKRAPCASAIRPTAAAAAPYPTLRPVISQAMPSVSVPVGTISAINPNAVIKVGAIPRPTMNAHAASVGTFTAAKNSTGKTPKIRA